MSGQKRKLTHNFISLSLVQGLSILFPLITFPYLLRVLGVEGFGLFTLIQTLIMYFDLLVSFGFGLTATQHVTKNLNDIGHLKKVISSVYVIKFLLFVCSMIAFLVIALFVPFFKGSVSLVFISSLYLLGNLLFPDWYFQGIQKMNNIALVAFISKIISLAMILVLVAGPSDLPYAILAVSVGGLTSGIVGIYLLHRSIPLKIVVPERTFLKSLFKESSYVFTSIFLAPLYSSVNLFILQAFTNPLMVGYYAIAEKIFGAIGMLTNIANRTFYPHLTQLYATSKEAFRKNVRSIVMIFFIAFLFLASLQFFFAEFIIRLISGSKDPLQVAYAADILRIMSVGLLFSPYVSFFFQLMIIQGQKKESIVNISIAVIINLISACIFAYFYSARGMAINLCIIVIIIAGLNFFAFNKKLKSTPLFT